METLEQHLSYEKDPENIRDTFFQLDNEMQVFHKRGYGVDVRPSKIEYSDGMFVFSNFNAGLDENERRQEITALAKLAAGTYYSLPSGQFIDYTKVSTDYLRDHFDELQMDSAILKATDGDSYYRDVIVEGKNGVYYNDYLVQLRESQSHNRTNTKSVVKSLGTYGKPNTVKEDPMGIPKNEMNNRQAAFIDIVFYPIILAAFAVMAYAFMILIKVL